VYRTYNNLKAIGDHPGSVHEYLTENNLLVKRNILGLLLNLQKITIRFENETKLQSVDNEMLEIVEGKYQHQLKSYENKISQLESDYSKAQHEIHELKEANKSKENDIDNYKQEIEKLKNKADKSSVSPYRTVTMSTQFSKESSSCVSVSVPSKIFKYGKVFLYKST